MKVPKIKPVPQTKTQKGFAQILIIIPLLLVTGIIASANFPVTTKFDNKTAQVLGEDNSNQSESGKKEEEKKAEEAKKEAEKVGQDVKNESKKTETETKKLSSQTSKTDSGTNKNQVQIENNKAETEVETPDGQKIKTKVEDDGTTKFEIEQGKLKIKYVIENGKVVLKAQNEKGDNVDLNEGQLAEVENEIKDNDVKIATESGKIRFGKDQKALTNFPLSINPLTNELVISTPSGEKIVTVLPDQAISNLLSRNVVNIIESSQSAGVTNAQSIQLIEKDGQAVYEINGIKKNKIFGFIPVDSKVKAFVSAETGDVVSKEESLLNKVIGIISF